MSRERLLALPRTPLAFLPTPLVELRRLGAALDGPRLFMKRDDMTGLALGGNKIRKLEFLLGEALDRGADTVVTGGALQSNHCRQTAAAAAMAGLGCHLALGGEEPEVAEGNYLLDRLFGAVVHWSGESRKGEAIPAIAGRLRAEGRRPYVIPYGGSNETGAMGFVAAAGELREQLGAGPGLRADAVVVASSSGGTHAGLTVGAFLFGLEARLVGIGIDKGEAGDEPYEQCLAGLATRVARRLGIEREFSPADFEVRAEYAAAGYGVVGEGEREAIRLLARHEGILLDPVYTGRAMAGLLDLIRKREFTRGETVVFWHTGGLPALFGYARELAGV